ncbi:MAG: hypothetical protein V3V31_13000 [Methylococcales bacterium]
MKDNKNNNRFVLLAMLSLTLIPFVLAWIVMQNPSVISGQVNYGNLVTPPRPIVTTELVAFDDFSKNYFDEFKGRWVFVHVATKQGCLSDCLESLYKTKQIRIMLNKELSRVRRLIVVNPEISELDAKLWWKDDPYLLRMRLTSELIAEMEKILGQPIPQGTIFLMDPIGNLMMWYPPGFDPYEVKKDLKRLLKVSQVG